MEALGLDLKLLLAQAVNFGLLFIVFRKFVYKPILKLIDERRELVKKTIADQQKSEEQLQKLAEKEKTVLKKARDEAEKEKEELLKVAQDERQQIVNHARRLAEQESVKGIAKIRQAESEAAKRLKGEVAQQVASNLSKKLSGKNQLLKDLLNE